jgi:hypothetical protein
MTRHKKKKILRLGFDESPNHSFDLPFFGVMVSSLNKKTSRVWLKHKKVREYRKNLIQENGPNLPVVGSDFRFVFFDPKLKKRGNYAALWDTAFYTLLKYHAEYAKREGFLIEPHIDGLFNLLSPTEDFVSYCKRERLIVDKLHFHPKNKTRYPKVPIIYEAHEICKHFKNTYKFHERLHGDSSCQGQRSDHNPLLCYKFHERRKNRILIPDKGDLELRLELVKK